MSIAIKLPDELVRAAKLRAQIEHRSAPKQIEFWAEIGRCAIDNPELPVPFILDAIISLKEAEGGLTEPYELD